ncbi:MAG: hypothetical protein M3R44_00970 [Candidatus Eremiobacteraeota bacterium]|nr:hypothetical protein [Candidatus Eremiobacteraeota bacterium]
MQQVTDWSSSIITGVTAGFSQLIGAIPYIIGALILLIVGWFVASIIGGLVGKLARAAHFDHIGDRTGINDFLAKTGKKLTPSGILGTIVKWAIFLIFIELAAEQLRLPQVTQIIDRAVAFIPNIVVAVLIMLVGAWIAQVLGGIVRGALLDAKVGGANALSQVVYGAVLAFAIIAALNQLEVARIVIDALYIAVLAALALAFGLAFGLGGQQAAAQLTNEWAGNAKDSAKKLQNAPSSGGQGRGGSSPPDIRTRS